MKLEVECMAYPAYQRLVAVRKSLDSLAEGYSQNDAPTLREPFLAAGVEETRNARSLGGQRLNSLKARVGREMQQVFLARQRRAQSGEVVRILMDRGVAVTARNPVTAVASILSNNTLFSNHHDDWGSGYGLREWDTKQPGRMTSSTEESAPNPQAVAATSATAADATSISSDAQRRDTADGIKIKAADQLSLSAA